jgi:hypothetical protein
MAAKGLELNMAIAYQNALVDKLTTQQSINIQMIIIVHILLCTHLNMGQIRLGPADLCCLTCLER